MTLPPRALTVLANMKAELLSREEREKAPLEKKKEEEPSGLRAEKPRVRTRRVARVSAFQRGCQRREWWAPVY